MFCFSDEKYPWSQAFNIKKIHDQSQNVFIPNDSIYHTQIECLPNARLLATYQGAKVIQSPSAQEGEGGTCKQVTVRNGVAAVHKVLRRVTDEDEVDSTWAERLESCRGRGLYCDC